MSALRFFYNARMLFFPSYCLGSLRSLGDCSVITNSGVVINGSFDLSSDIYCVFQQGVFEDFYAKQLYMPPAT
jgi:hypothetical protein